MKEFLFLFKGENETAIPCAYSNLPTDPTKVIDKIKQEFISDPLFRDNVISSLIIMGLDPKYAWFSLYYLYQLIRLNKVYKLSLNIKNIIYQIEFGLKNSELQLKKCFKWVGNNYNNGLWGDVERLTENIFEEFGYKIYPQIK